MRLFQESAYLHTEKGNHATGRSGRVDGRKHLFPADDGMLGAFVADASTPVQPIRYPVQAQRSGAAAMVPG